MARISIEELHRGEGSGAKYGVGGIIGAVMQEVMIHGVSKEYDERTYIELLIMKHTLKAAEQMKNEGDFVSEMTDAEPPSCYGKITGEYVIYRGMDCSVDGVQYLNVETYLCCI